MHFFSSAETKTLKNIYFPTYLDSNINSDSVIWLHIRHLITQDLKKNTTLSWKQDAELAFTDLGCRPGFDLWLQRLRPSQVRRCRKLPERRRPAPYPLETPSDPRSAGWWSRLGNHNNELGSDSSPSQRNINRCQIKPLGRC